jgi:hypothetical protein
MADKIDPRDVLDLFINPMGGMVFLTPELEALASREAKAKIAWLKDYASIQEQAAKGDSIQASQFAQADEAFNRQYADIEKSTQSEIKTIVADIAEGRRYVDPETRKVLDTPLELVVDPLGLTAYQPPLLIDPQTGLPLDPNPIADPVNPITGQPNYNPIPLTPPLDPPVSLRDLDRLPQIDPVTGLPMPLDIDQDTGLPAYGPLRPQISKEEKQHELSLNLMYQGAVNKEVKAWMETQPDLHARMNDTHVLEAVFYRDHVRQGPAKNLDIGQGADTPGELMAALLKNNQGIALGDIHVYDESSKLIADNTETLKKSGVKTIYLEFDDKKFRQLDALTPAQLKELQKNGVYGDITISSAEKMAQGYGVATKDDSMASVVGMIAAAKEGGMRVVNIDRKGEARNYELRAGKQRLVTTNYTWVDAIEKDRAGMLKRGEDPGKYLVFGGNGHFTGEGMVDEALGIPTIGFDNREKKPGAGLVRGHSKNGADFYLPGGTDYVDMRKMAHAEDLKDHSETLKHLGFIPGAGMARALLMGLSIKERIESVTTLIPEIPEPRPWTPYSGEKRAPSIPEIPELKDFIRRRPGSPAISPGTEPVREDDLLTPPTTPSTPLPSRRRDL